MSVQSVQSVPDIPKLPSLLKFESFDHGKKCIDLLEKYNLLFSDLNSKHNSLCLLVKEIKSSVEELCKQNNSEDLVLNKVNIDKIITKIYKQQSTSDSYKEFLRDTDKQKNLITDNINLIDSYFCQKNDYTLFKKIEEFQLFLTKVKYLDNFKKLIELKKEIEVLTDKESIASTAKFFDNDSFTLPIDKNGKVKIYRFLGFSKEIDPSCKLQCDIIQKKYNSFINKKIELYNDGRDEVKKLGFSDEVNPFFILLYEIS